MPTRDVVIYTTMFCPYCRDAKVLLDRKGVSYREIGIDGDREARISMSERAGGRTTVPQVFVGDRHIGGCDDLYTLDAAGELDPLIAEHTG